MKPTLEDFLKDWRPMPGAANPERVHSVFCEWMIRRKLEATSEDDRACAYSGTKELGVPEQYGRFDGYAPVWCFERFGRTVTELEDGTRLYVGGEHEDHYDPDFCIYNDVVRVPPGGTPELYRYPEEVFPPTDFHTATPVGRELVIIGRLGYYHMRRPGETPVYALDTATLAIRPVSTCGDSPGYIYEHTAVPDAAAGGIRISGGYRAVDDGAGGARPVPNFDEYVLGLFDWRWRRLTRRSGWRTYGIRYETMRDLSKLSIEAMMVRSPGCVLPGFGLSLIETVPEDDACPYQAFVLSCEGVRLRVSERFEGEWDIVVEGDAEPTVLAAYLQALADGATATYGHRFRVVASPHDFKHR